MSVTRYEFPKTLNERMEAVLSIVNTEFKSLTWHLMSERWSSTGDLRIEYEKNTGKLLGVSNFSAYNEKTLIPIGLVAKKHVMKRGYGLVNKYSLTEEGAYYQPIAAFTIKKAVDMGTSMYEIFGSTHSSGQYRSPYATYKILKELYNNKNKKLREIDIVRKCEIGSKSFISSIKRLASVGFVNYDSVGTENSKGMFMYQWIGGNPDNAIGHAKFPAETMQSAARLAKELGKIEASMLADNLGLEKNTCRILIGGLAKQGYLKPEKFKGSEILSEASMANDGKEFYETFLHHLEDSFKNKLTNEVADTSNRFRIHARSSRSLCTIL